MQVFVFQLILVPVVASTRELLLATLDTRVDRQAVETMVTPADQQAVVVMVDSQVDQPEVVAVEMPAIHPAVHLPVAIEVQPTVDDRLVVHPVTSMCRLLPANHSGRVATVDSTPNPDTLTKYQVKC